MTPSRNHCRTHRQIDGRPIASVMTWSTHLARSRYWIAVRAFAARALRRAGDASRWNYFAQGTTDDTRRTRAELSAAEAEGEAAGAMMGALLNAYDLGVRDGLSQKGSDDGCS